jgi:hypothetical protein
MALFERDQLPSRSALSRDFSALTQAPVEALRTLFFDDLLGRPLSPDKQTGGLVDRVGNVWMVFDIDGTREAARQRALPQTEELPPASHRLDEVCAPGYRGRKCGQVVRPRTVISQAHSYYWLGSFGAPRATDAIGKNCSRGFPPLVAISLPISSNLRARCSGSTANMELEPCSRIWQALPL